MEEHAASAPVRDTYEEIRRDLGMGKVPNLLKSMAGRPDLLRGTWGLVKAVLVEGTIPRATKEIILTAISGISKNIYCRELHAASLAMLGIEKEVIADLIASGDSARLPEKTRTILKFAVKAAFHPSEVGDEDFAVLRREGLREEEIQEILATVALITSMNVYAHAVNVELDGF